MAHDVFISYTMEDKPIADAVCATLESEDIRCWIAPRDVLPSSDWSDSILGAITGSRAMVLIFSSHANKSFQIKREVNHAIEKGLPVIPFRIENVDPTGALEYYLDVTHWLDALTPPMEKHIQQLAKTIRRLLEKPEPQPPPQSSAPSKSDKRLWIGGAAAILAAAIIIGVLANVNWSSDDDRVVVNGNTTGLSSNNTTPSPYTNAGGASANTNQNSDDKRAAGSENMTGPSPDNPDPISTAASDLDNPALRIDAILRLEQLAKRSKADHWRVVQLLTGYIRRNARWTGGTNRPAKQVPDDIQTILTVLGRRQWWYKHGEDTPLELSDTDLRGADLRVEGGGAHFEGVRLQNAHLEEANLRGIHFEEAILMGAHFERAYLSGAHLRLADIQDANFRGADLTAITGIPVSQIKGLADTDGAKF